MLKVLHALTSISLQHIRHVVLSLWLSVILSAAIAEQYAQRSATRPREAVIV